jgi:hypothetical protein
MNSELKKHLTTKSTWIKGLYIILFAIIFNIAEFLIAAVVTLQFVLTLLTGKNNERLLVFGQNLSIFSYQVIRFMTFNSSEKPYPFSPWPGEAPLTSKQEDTAPKSVDEGSETRESGKEPDTKE